MGHTKKVSLLESNLIHDQFKARQQFITQAWLWCGINPDDCQIDLDRLEKHSGIRCSYLRNRLVGFEIVDVDKYIWWVLQWT
jgi:hypothetical protein